MQEHPNVTTLKALTVSQIRGFTRDQALKYQGLELNLTGDQRAQCQLQLELLAERIQQVKEKKPQINNPTLSKTQKPKSSLFKGPQKNKIKELMQLQQVQRQQIGFLNSQGQQQQHINTVNLQSDHGKIN